MRHYTTIYYIMSITRDRFGPYWVSSGGLLSMSCDCVLECDPLDIGIAVSCCFVLPFFAPKGKFVFLACLLLSVFCTRLMRPNKVETGRGLLA